MTNQMKENNECEHAREGEAEEREAYTINCFMCARVCDPVLLSLYVSAFMYTILCREIQSPWTHACDCISSFVMKDIYTQTLTHVVITSCTHRHSERETVTKGTVRAPEVKRTMYI